MGKFKRALKHHLKQQLDNASGKELDRLAYMYGIKRSKRFIFFKESDRSLRERVLSKVLKKR